MTKLNGTGPEGKGSSTGRGLGKCKKDKNNDLKKSQLGKGMGLKRKCGGGVGLGKRLKYDE